MSEQRTSGMVYLVKSPGDTLSINDIVDIPLPSDGLPPTTQSMFYLVRLEGTARGVIATGTYHDSDSETVSVRITETRDECESGLLPLFLLFLACHYFGFNRTKIDLGWMLPDDVAALISQMWTDGRDVHSLRQLVEWQYNDELMKDTPWLADYRQGTNAARALAQADAVVSDDDVQWLWQKKDNSICDPGHWACLSEGEAAANLAFLKACTKEILHAPDKSTWEAVRQKWQDATRQKQFSKNHYALIDRVFAAAAPERYTTIVSETFGNSLLSLLGTDFATGARRFKNFIHFNETLLAFLKEAGVDAPDPHVRNIALWSLCNEMGNYQSHFPLVAPAETTMLPTAQGKAQVTEPLNQILYGPPGTGKTYRTMELAVRIVNPALFVARTPEREEIRAAWHRAIDSGQVVFTTFHQSLSYEAFVEGITVSTRDGQPVYQTEPGIFKSLCQRASNEKRDTFTGDFESACQAFNKAIARAGGVLTLETKTGKAFTVRVSGQGNYLVRPLSSQSGNADPTVSKKNLAVVYETGEAGVDDGVRSYKMAIARYMQTQLKASPQTSEPAEATPYVLIIDEINRGNVSRIFGELITLLEPDKREGGKEALCVQLPYSRESFSVPANLYVIGTMNTSDRSLATLDLALRRRFIFTQVLPDSRLLAGKEIAGINLGDLLQVMNERIEILLDADHMIGHAYFLPLLEKRELTDLAWVFTTQIIPLLGEYFYDDAQRIAWVLNDHRKAPDKQIITPLADRKSVLFGEDVTIPSGLRKWRLNEDALNNPDAFAQIISVAS